MMGIDELIERAQEQRARRDQAAAELTAIVKALDGMAGVGMLDDSQRRSLAALKRPKRATASRRRKGSKS